MPQARSQRLWPPSRSWLVFVALGATTWVVQGCGDDTGQGGGGASSTSNGTQSGPTTTGDTTSTSTTGSANTSSSSSGTPTYTITETANDPTQFLAAFDATPSPDGSTVYFTGIDTAGDSGVFSVTGGNVTKIVSGSPMVGPFGIATSTNGSLLYIADPASVEAANAADHGRIFSLEGSALTSLDGSVGFRPRGVEVHDDGTGDLLYFTGSDTDGVAAVFTLDPSGSADAIAKGAPLTDPSGIAVSSSGKVFVLDTTGAKDQSSSVIVIDGTNATELVSGLRVGYPGGIAVRPDGNTVFVMGYDKAKGTDAVYQIDASASPPTVQLISNGISDLTEPAGLHAAKAADVFALVDGKGGGSGTILSLHP